MSARPSRRTAEGYTLDAATDAPLTCDAPHSPRLASPRLSPGAPNGPGAPSAARLARAQVVLYESYASQKAVLVKPGARFQNRYGVFELGSLVGERYGGRIFDNKGKGFVHVLRATSELWTRVLPHRTQILYHPDISVVLAGLELRPGSVVVESGTGSGSLTTALARCVAPHGAVRTYEFNPGRADRARAEFEENGLTDMVTVVTRDVEADGFGEDAEGCADGVFLDLPSPWRAVPHAAAALRPGGLVCSFSPCIEQVQRAAEALCREGFCELTTVECLLRAYETHAEDVIIDMDREPAPGVKGGGLAERGAKRKRMADASVDNKPTGGSAEGGEVRALVARADAPRVRVRACGGADARADVVRCASQKSDVAPQSRTIVSCRPSIEAVGHTGYLTFARRVM